MKKLVFSIFILLLCIFASCDNKKNPSDSKIDEPQTEYWPLTIGNTWWYSMDNNNYVMPTDTERVVDRVKINNHYYYKFDYSHIIGRDLLLSDIDSMIYFLNIEDSTGHVLFDFTATAGDTWYFPDGYECSIGYGMTLISRNDTVELPIGKFENCYHFKYLCNCIDAGMIESWFVKGIGIVKSNFETWGGIVTTNLLSYAIVVEESEK